METKIKACIFDLDGTISNTINSIAYFANNALAKYNLPPVETEKYKYFVGDGADTLVHRMMAEVGEEREEIFEKVLEYYNTTYDNDFMYLTHVYDGIPETIAALKNKGIKIAVLSNKPHPTTVKVINELFGEGYFDICYGNRPGIPKKPDPSPLLDIIESFGFEKDECLYIGDTSTDMKTGKGAGLFTIGVLWGFRDETDLTLADAIIKEPAEILNFI